MIHISKIGAFITLTVAAILALSACSEDNGSGLEAPGVEVTLRFDPPTPRPQAITFTVFDSNGNEAARGETDTHAKGRNVTGNRALTHFSNTKVEPRVFLHEGGSVARFFPGRLPPLPLLPGRLALHSFCTHSALILHRYGRQEIGGIQKGSTDTATRG